MLRAFYLQSECVTREIKLISTKRLGRIKNSIMHNEWKNTSFPIMANQIHICLLIQRQTQVASVIKHLCSSIELSASPIYTAPLANINYICLFYFILSEGILVPVPDHGVICLN